MFDQLFWTIKILFVVIKSLVLDVKALSFDIYAALHGWSSEIYFSEDIAHLLKDIVDYFYYVIKAAIIVAPAASLLSVVITATNKWLDPETPEEELFLFLLIALFAGILFLAI